MRGGTVIVAGVVISALVFGLFQIKLAVQNLEGRLMTLDRALLKSETEIHVLRAEWAYLNLPERLARLAARYLDLAPLRAEQIVSIGQRSAPRPAAATLASLGPAGGAAGGEARP